MTTHPDLEALFAALESGPEDWPLYLVLADLYEECGDTDAAACLRWQAKERKRPYRWRMEESIGWTWFDASRVATDHDPESNLPHGLHALLRGGNYAAAGREREFDSLRAAQDALIAAWKLWEDRPR